MQFALSTHLFHGDRLTRSHIELAHEKDVERGLQPLGHLTGDRHPSSGQSKDDDVRAACVAGQMRGQPAAGVFAIEEPHRETLLKRTRVHATWRDAS